MERMALLVPAVVFYTLGTAIAVGVLVEILVSVVQSAVNGVANTARGLRCCGNTCSTGKNLRNGLQSAGNRKTRDEPHGKTQEGT